MRRYRIESQLHRIPQKPPGTVGNNGNYYETQHGIDPGNTCSFNKETAYYHPYGNTRISCHVQKSTLNVQVSFLAFHEQERSNGIDGDPYPGNDHDDIPRNFHRILHPTTLGGC